MYKTSKLKQSVIFFLALLLCILSGCTKTTPPPTQTTGFAMGSLVTQTLPAGTDATLSNEVLAQLNSLEKEISWRVETSSVAKLNAADGQPVPLPEETFALLQTAQDVANHSQNAFHPLLLPLSRLWNFDGEAFTPPTAEDVAAALAHTSADALLLTSSTCTAQLTDPDSAIDLGGIGKGAACDTALEVYRAQKLSSALVTVGGSVGVLGTKPDGTPWKIGVRDPNGDANTSLGVLSLTDQCVSTSGTYEKGATVDGIHYHHLIDPSTGYPVENSLLSVTVLHSSGALTDALATACMVLGKEASLPLLEHYKAQAIFIEKDHTVTLTDGLHETFRLTSEAYFLAE